MNFTNHITQARLSKGILITIAFSLLIPLQVSAAQLTSRKITIGSSAPSASTTHQYDFTIPASNNLGSIRFTYCLAPSGSCTAPTDLNVDSVSISGQTGATGFSVDATETTAGVIGITRTASSASGAVSYTFSSTVNGSTANQTFYVRIETFNNNNFTGLQDSGTVAGSTANQIQVTAQVDESLNFCVFQTGTNCGNGTGTSVALGTLSSSAASSGTSKLVAGTNAGAGYVIQYTGPTLTSGGNTIAATGAAGAASSTGSAQFGLNLVSNTTPSVGSNPSGGTGAASTNYGTGNTFSFLPSTLTQIASAASSSSDTLYTVSYLANIPSNQQAGAYTTTLTFICTATF
jgi:hypothetical protein